MSARDRGKANMAQHKVDDNFMMDFENWVLEHKWDARAGIPIGKDRHENEAWAEVMREALEFSDTTWAVYVAWVKAGGGDEWFQE